MRCLWPEGKNACVECQRQKKRCWGYAGWTEEQAGRKRKSEKKAGKGKNGSGKAGGKRKRVEAESEDESEEDEDEEEEEEEEEEVKAPTKKKARVEVEIRRGPTRGKKAEGTRSKEMEREMEKLAGELGGMVEAEKEDYEWKRDLMYVQAMEEQVEKLDVEIWMREDVKGMLRRKIEEIKNKWEKN
jgi:hypothetical protein